MISDIIEITSGGENIGAALDLPRKVAAYSDLSPKGALQLRLLTEEMMGMMRSIMGEVSARFWIEEENDVYQLRLSVDSALNKEKREQLLAVSSTGKNEATRSFMGRLREFFFRDVDDQIAAYNNPLLAAGNNPDVARPVTDWEWQMTRYQEILSSMREEKPEAAEAWDELEKSVVSHVADDVKISIKGFQTDMTIIKKLL